MQNSKIQMSNYKQGFKVEICYLLFGTLFVICYLLFGISRVNAQENVIGLSISPTLDVVDIHDHDPLVLAYTIENVSSVDLNITPTMRTFHADGAGGIPVLDDPVPLPFVEIQTPGFTLGKSFTLPSGQKQQLVLHISPPEKLDHDLTMTLLAQGKPNDSQNVGNSSTKTTVTIIGAHMILRVPSKNSSKTNPLNIISAKIPTLLDIFWSLHPSFLVSNSDSTTHQIRGTLTFKRGSNVIDTYALAPDFILPQSARVLRLLKEEAGQKQPQDLKFSAPFLPWIYTLTITLSDEVGNLNTSSYTIYMLPLLLVCFTVIMFVLMLVAKSLTVDRKSQV